MFFGRDEASDERRMNGSTSELALLFRANRDATQLGASRMTRRLVLSMFAAVMLAGSGALVRAQDSSVDKTKADAFDARLFAGTVGKKAYACFVRHYDADHLARHPKQKVSAMQLLVTTEIPTGETTLNYSFRLGVSYRHRGGDLDSSGYRNHPVAEDSGKETRLERITVWQRNKPDDDVGDALLAGADDKVSGWTAQTRAIAPIS
jgi:hypothetical protein